MGGRVEVVVVVVVGMGELRSGRWDRKARRSDFEGVVGGGGMGWRGRLWGFEAGREGARGRARRGLTRRRKREGRPRLGDVR